MTEPTIRPVQGKADLKEFIEVPYRLRANDPQWVPPLRFERRQFLDRSKNPWFQHAEAELFLCERAGATVGRISAHVDRRWDEFQGGNDGMFGFFDAIEDEAVVGALIEAASGWLAERDRDRMLGPMDFTMNDECGILIEGFDEPSMILEPWHPPYYQRLLEARGLGKAIDLLMWELWFGQLKEGTEMHPMIHAAAAKSREEGVVLRNMRKRDMEAEVARFMEVYNEAWGHNWGFVPITEAEVAFQAKNLKPVLDENWAMIAEKDGEVVGAALTLPGRRAGAGADGGQAAALRLVALPAPQELHRPPARLRARGQGRLPAPRRRGGAVRAPRADRGHGRAPRRSHGVDPGDQRPDEPGDGGDGGTGRPAVPDLRARARKSSA